MKHEKSAKPGASKSLLPLVPLGAAAVVAGCSGGNATPQAPPSAQTPGKSSYATTTAMLTITIPARAKTSAIDRSPDYISQGSAAVGVSISPAAGPSATPTFFPLPPPGPNPTTTTLPVTAPLGADTVAVDIYDALPSATAAPNLLSEGTTTATIATGSTELAVQTLGVAQGVILRKGAATSEEVLQNDATAQGAALVATPIDADGFAITGTLAHSVALTGPAGVSVSPSTLTTAGNVTASYAASQTSAGGRVTAGLPLDTKSGSTDNFTISATQYVFVASDDGNAGTLTVIDPLARKIVASVPLPATGPYGIAAMAGCAGNETAAVAWGTASGAKTTGVTVAAPGSSSAAATEDLTAVIAPRTIRPEGSSPSYFASDSKCGLYSANDPALHRYSGFPAATGTAIASTGWDANSSIAYVGGTVYGINVATDPEIPGANTTDVQSVAATGGAVTDLGSTFQESQIDDFGLEVGGVFCYELIQCDGGYSVVTVPGFIESDNVDDSGFDVEDFAVSPNGTLYLAMGDGTGGRDQVRLGHTRPQGRAGALHPAKGAGHSRVRGDTIGGNPPPTFSFTADGVGVSADGRFIAVGKSGGIAGHPEVQIFSAPATAGDTPTALGTPIPLPSAAPFVSRVVFPR